MIRVIGFITICCLGASGAPAWANDAPTGCVSVDVPKAAAKSIGATWTNLTSAQWQFLRGIYAMNPLTPAGLPYGDHAALVSRDGHAGVVLFIDGETACTPMDVPEILMKMLDDVAAGKISHEGTGL